jgi:hypothetical protein
MCLVNALLAGRWLYMMVPHLKMLDMHRLLQHSRQRSSALTSCWLCLIAAAAKLHTIAMLTILVV